MVFNNIGIIDGQHRVFAYHEGTDVHERKIAQKRAKQLLLATGIIYPEGVSEDQQRKFEAELFLEINDKQSKSRADLRQAIQTIVEPFSAVAIAKAVINELSRSSVLRGLLDDHYFGEGTIKTSSIVSYGLRHIVAFEGSSSLFELWGDSDKSELKNRSDSTLLRKYALFCATELGRLLSAFKITILTKGLWTTDQKRSRALTTTSINGLIFLFRILIQKRETGTLEYYQGRLAKMSVDFAYGKFRYKSSNWKALGEKLYDECFATTGD